MKTKICVITGTRAEYGILRLLMLGIKASDKLQLQIIATGSHLSPEFGLTYREIEADGFFIDKKLEMVLSSDTGTSIAKSMGLGMVGFSDAYDVLKPDFIVVLGDRYELLAAASAALVCRIPIIHIHGGETTEGAFDEAIRHSITKMAAVHFTAAEAYRKRLIQLGEQPGSVHLVGGLGIDAIRKLKLLSRPELEKALDFRFGEKSLVVTFHPTTLENNTSEKQMTELLAAIENFPTCNFLFTMPNADSDSRIIFQMIENFVSSHKNTAAFTSLGQVKYFSAVAVADGVIGNSSSGLLEVPTFKKGTVNIGDRQKGRLRAASVIDCAADRHQITASIHKLYSKEFQVKLASVVNPYGEGGVTEKILAIMNTLDKNMSLKKAFYDL